MVGNLLNLKQLEALVQVADLGSFRKAAHHLNTTQPNISARIAGLEKTLQVVLMQRDAGSVTLTGKGKEIRDAARVVLQKAEAIVDIAQRRDLIEDRLRLGVTELVACTWLHAWLRKIKATYPALNVELTVDLSAHLDMELTANRLDLAIQTAPFASAASGVCELGKFPYIWVASPGISTSLQGPRTVADLLTHSVLTHARHTQAFRELSDHVAKATLPTSRLVSSNSLGSCVQMAKDGMGVTLLPTALVRRELRTGSLARVDVDWLPSPLRFAARFQREKAALHVAEVARLAEVAVAEFRRADDQD